MSTEQVNIAIGAGQLVVMLLVFFGVDQRITQRIKKQSDPSPMLPINVPVKSNRRAKLVVILAIGGLAFSGYGYYRTTVPLTATQNRVAPKNIEVHVRRWLEGLMITSQKPPDNISFMIQGMSQGGVPFIIAQQKDHNDYLVLQVIGVFSPEHRDVFDKMSPSEQQNFVQQIANKAAKEKITIALIGPTDIIERKIAINDNLTEASFLAALDELCTESLTVKNIVGDAFDQLTNPKQQPLPTPHKAASPH